MAGASEPRNPRSGMDEATLRNLFEAGSSSRVVLVIRHAAREGPPPGTHSGAAESWRLTPEGRADARRFGSGLPGFHNLVLAHTASERTQETAQELAEGFLLRHPQSRISNDGVEPALSPWSYYAKDRAGLDEWRTTHASRFFEEWLRGGVPSRILLPIEDAIPDLIRRLRARIERCPESSLMVAVSHDVLLLALRGVLFPDEEAMAGPVGFLEGIQLRWDTEGRLVGRWRNRTVRDNRLPGARAG